MDLLIFRRGWILQKEHLGFLLFNLNEFLRVKCSFLKRIFFMRKRFTEYWTPLKVHSIYREVNHLGSDQQWHRGLCNLQEKIKEGGVGLVEWGILLCQKVDVDFIDRAKAGWSNGGPGGMGWASRGFPEEKCGLSSKVEALDRGRSCGIVRRWWSWKDRTCWRGERGKNLEAMSIFCLSTLVTGCTYPNGAVLAVGRWGFLSGYIQWAWRSVFHLMLRQSGPEWEREQIVCWDDHLQWWEHKIEIGNVGDPLWERETICPGDLTFVRTFTGRNWENISGWFPVCRGMEEANMIKHVKVQLVFQRSDSSDAMQHRKCPWKS